MTPAIQASSRIRIDITMNDLTKRFFAASGWLVLLLALVAGIAWGQATTQSPDSGAPAAPAANADKGPQSQDNPAQGTPDKSSPDSRGRDSQPGQNDQSAESGEPQGEHHITQAEANELFRSVDEILSFASKDTALPIHKEVKRRLASRDEVVAFVEKHMSDDEDAQRLRRSELVLKKFGLLPPDFDMQKFLVALLREQVAGYYDPKTKAVNLLDWIDAEQQKPVLAHELTHALQDQSFGLEKFMKAADFDVDKKKDPRPEDIDRDEALAARQAVVEGQAMVVLLDYMLAPMGKSLLTSPDMVAALKAGMLVGTADWVTFRDAPIYLKEALTFPYRYGIDFETELLTRGGKQMAFAEAFTNPPKSTRQIMEPQTYLSGERLDPMRLPDFEHDFKSYDRFDIGAIGEFDVAVLVDQYAGAEASKRLYPHWRGGYYYTGRPKGDALAPLGLLYISRWSSAEDASDFAEIYAGYLAKRYRRAHEVEMTTVEKRQSPKLITVSSTPATLSGKHEWLTENGPVWIEVAGNTVLVSESLDQATTETVEREVLEGKTVK